MAYDPTKDDSGVTPSPYNTGAGLGARLRKINLNVDIATQDELNEVFNTLSAAISATGTEWKEADAVLCSALSTEISNEVARATGAEEAIVASLSAYALSTTVADAYAVSVLAAQEGDHDNYYYTVKQGEKTVGTIDIAKDQFVSAAHFDGTILILDLRNGDTISTDLSGLVDVYNGSEDTEVKVTTDGNVISVELKDTIARVGTAGDLSTATTLWGVKNYATELVADKNVTATGETGEGALVTASAEDNAVTVGSTAKLTAAVAAAETAVQTVTGDDYLTATKDGTTVSITAQNKLTAVVAAVETSASIWNAAEPNAKAYTDDEIAGLSTTTHAEIVATKNALISGDGVTSADYTLAGVKAYVDAKVADKNVDAEGDAIVEASAADNKVTVKASVALSDVVAKVQAASADWDSAEQNAKDYADTLSAAVSATANAEIAAALTSAKDYTDVVSGALSTTAAADIATAKADVIGLTSDLSSADTINGAKTYAKDYTDEQVAAAAVTAAGDAIVSATADGKNVTVGATQKLSTDIARLEASADDWDQVSAKYDTAALVAAANELSVLSLSALSDYNDIDEIITEVETIKGALINFTRALEA